MLRFSIHDESGPSHARRLAGAHLIGRDDQPVPGTVREKGGQILCQKRGSRTVGLCLLYDAGAMGRLMLQTCLLPDREQPYNLAVELARHRIKFFIAKSEEWQMFDLSEGHPAMQMWEEARGLFSQAVVCEEPKEADRLARASLERGIEASERLALAHAEILLHRRFATRRAASTTLGVRIAPGRDGSGLRDLVARDFDVVVIPLRWRDLEVEEGRYNWESVDRWMQWARDAGKPVVAGPLLDFSRDALPDWMYVWQHDYETCRDMAYDHLERIVQRYRSFVGIWNVASGLNVNDNFQFTAEQMIGLVRMAAILVRQSQKDGRVMVELTQPFGEHGSAQRDSLPPLTYIERLMQEGIRLHAIGVQVLFGHHKPGRGSRDLMQMSSMLDRYFPLELPVILSAAGVPSEMRGGDGDAGGYWHEPWSAQTQSTWVGQAFALAMSKPYVESFLWADLFDHPAALLPAGGLITETGRAKPALSRLVNLRKRLRKPLGPLKNKLPARADVTPIAEG